MAVKADQLYEDDFNGDEENYNWGWENETGILCVCYLLTEVADVYEAKNYGTPTDKIQ